MTIEEYEPRSMLVTRETPARRAKFPFVDIHGHQDLTMSGAELASLVKQMDAMNTRTMNNLSGGWGDKLTAQVRNVRAKYPGRFTVFANIDWSRVSEPHFAQNAAAQLGHDVKVGGAAGPAFFLPIDAHNERSLELEQYLNRARPASKYPPFDSPIAERHRMFKRHARTQTFGGQDELAVYFRIFETTDEYFPWYRRRWFAGLASATLSRYTAMLCLMAGTG